MSTLASCLADALTRPQPEFPGARFRLLILCDECGAQVLDEEIHATMASLWESLSAYLAHDARHERWFHYRVEAFRVPVPAVVGTAVGPHGEVPTALAGAAADDAAFSEGGC